MRIVALAMLSVAALSLQAAPVPHKAVPASLGLAPVVELAIRGCGLVWHHGYWQDPSGKWYWGHCFPSWR